MTISIEQLVARIHDTPVRVVLAVTGGGSRAIAELLEVPGASRTLLEAVVPYCAAAMIDWLGGEPDQFCSEPTARAMAMAAYRRACRHQESDTAGQASSGTPRQANDTGGQAASGARYASDVRLTNRVAGVACTASLASDRPKRGPHRIHLAIQTATTTISRSLELVKGRRTRAEEERIAAALVLGAVAEACGLDERLELPLLAAEKLDEQKIVAPLAWQELLAGHHEMVPGGRAAGEQAATPRAVFPGAFHPLHAGHRRMAEIAKNLLGVPVEFEISIENVDKPPLDFLEIEHRLAQFAPGQSVWLTRAPTFDEKSLCFPGATFVVGIDTLRRIADCGYHGGNAASWQSAIERIAARGCRFLVFGREHEGRFVGLGDLELPDSLRSLCQEIPANQFRLDISSTAIRRQDEKNDE